MTDFSLLNQARAALANPYLRPDELQNIAAQHRELWVDIARHPAAYPALLGWMHQYGDDAVRAVIANRNQPPAQPTQPGRPPLPAPGVAQPQPYLTPGWQGPPTPAMPSAQPYPAPNVPTPQPYQVPVAPPAQPYPTPAVPPAQPYQAPVAPPTQQYPTPVAPPVQPYQAPVAPPTLPYPAPTPQPYAVPVAPPVQSHPTPVLPPPAQAALLIPPHPQSSPMPEADVQLPAQEPTQVSHPTPNEHETAWAAATETESVAEPEAAAAAEPEPAPEPEPEAAPEPEPETAAEPEAIEPEPVAEPEATAPEAETTVAVEAESVIEPVAPTAEVHGEWTANLGAAIVTPSPTPSPVEVADDPFSHPIPEAPRTEPMPAFPGQDSAPMVAMPAQTTAEQLLAPAPPARAMPPYATGQPAWNPAGTTEPTRALPPFALPPQPPQVTSVPLGQPPKKNNNKLIGIIAGGVVLLLLAGFAVWQLAFNSGGNSSSTVSLTTTQFSYLAEESLPTETDLSFTLDNQLPSMSDEWLEIFGSGNSADDLQRHMQLYAESQSVSLFLFDNAVNATKLQTAFADLALAQPGSLKTLDEVTNSVRVWAATTTDGGFIAVSVYGNVVAIQADTINDPQNWKETWLLSFKKAVDAAATSPALGGTIAPAPNINTPSPNPIPTTVPPKSLAPAPNPSSTRPVSAETKFSGTADFPQCDSLTVNFILNEDRTAIRQLKIEAAGLAGSDNITKVNQSSDGPFYVEADGRLKVSIEDSVLDVVIDGDTAVGTITFVFNMKGAGNTNDLYLDFGSKPITLTAS